MTYAVSGAWLVSTPNEPQTERHKMKRRETYIKMKNRRAVTALVAYVVLVMLPLIWLTQNIWLPY